MKSGIRARLQSGKAYFCLLASVDLVNFYVLWPLFRLLTTFLLQEIALPFISLPSTLTILSQHPFLVMLLLFELGIFLACLYGQCIYLIVGVAAIKMGITSLWVVLGSTWIKLKQLGWTPVPFFMVGLAVLGPGITVVYHTPLLGKLNWSMLLHYLMVEKSSMVLILGILYLFLLYILLSKVSRRSDWRQIIKLNLVGIFGVGICDVGILGLQFFIDHQGGQWSGVSIWLNLTLIQFSNQLILGTMMVLNISQLLPVSKSLQTTSIQSRYQGLVVAVLLILAGGAIGWESWLNVPDSGQRGAEIISHRGVSQQNGVQNSLPALIRTAQIKPDYVETDLHETRDGQFVVLHDENLQGLAGIKRAPYQLTLKQLEKLHVREKGQTASLISADQYLTMAQKKKQRLLLEIKTTPHDSRGMLTHFCQHYQALILRNHWMVHSLDYRVIKGLKSEAPQIKVAYLLPYNVVYPIGLTDAYGVQYATLTREFVAWAHWQDKQVYAWTVSDPASVKKLLAFGVDGLVTDDVQRVRQAQKDYRRQNSSVRYLANYLGWPIW
ncbi:glycerophosphodiester phosphodiesterase [Ligilactobacillus equi]|uniref:glycerophosphodiester phosphodiesterase n=1 Tax=Ligilactobacillus equi TaxID=137357 RepID=UPI002ED4D0FA